jgi:hypothetical protein
MHFCPGGKDNTEANTRFRSANFSNQLAAVGGLIWFGQMLTRRCENNTAGGEFSFGYRHATKIMPSCLSFAFDGMVAYIEHCFFYYDLTKSNP